jgi:Fe2+ transport system protein FeoA
VNKQTPVSIILEGECANPGLCPLTCVKPGSVVCIRELAVTPEVRERLREMGFCEKQHIKLVSRHSSVICQVCNARLGISRKLAETILVEPVPLRREAA